MNITDLPAEITDLPVPLVDVIKQVMEDAYHITTLPKETKDLPESVIELVIHMFEEGENALRHLEAISDLPADITQIDVARALVELFGENIRYNPEAQMWLVFDPASGWEWDPYSFSVRQLVAFTLRALVEAIPEDLEGYQLRQFEKARRNRARQMETSGAINSIVSLASADQQIHCKEGDIDSIPDVVGTPSGAVDLRSGKLIPYASSWITTRRVAVDLDPTARCDRWELFLREVLGEDDEVQDYFQKLVGYTLTGHTNLQQMWLMVGRGSNGKSTLLRILQRVLGPGYAQQTPESVLFGRPSAGGASSELVRLKGVRCALLTETGYGQSINEERVKALVAADTVAARGLYREFEEFTPQAKFFLATNHLPVVRGSDKGIWRRLVVVPFDNEFEVHADPTLYQDLVDELPGIFAWAVRGAVRWYKTSRVLSVPTPWRLATSNYRLEQDALKGFLDERVVFEPAAFVGATELYEDYKAWCDVEGRQAISQNEFGPRMMATGSVNRARKGKQNRYHYVGVRLRGEAS
jgi:P4 family phage/plasmid primase-like protien